MSDPWVIVILYNMSYCHFVQDNLYNYDKKLGEEEQIDTIPFALLQNQLKRDLEDCYCQHLARKGAKGV